jgi:hypothetical protein
MCATSSRKLHGTVVIDVRKHGIVFGGCHSFFVVVVLDSLKFFSIKDGFQLWNIKVSAGMRSGEISSICDSD